MTFSTRLRDFLLKHPLLVIELGFDLHLDSRTLYGFDVEKTLPSRYWLGEKLRQLDRGLLTDLLAATVRALQVEIPGLGETVAFDVKHIYAWVRENNPQVYVKGPYNVSYIPKGDPDCRLGVKKSSNQKSSAEVPSQCGDGSATGSEPASALAASGPSTQTGKSKGKGKTKNKDEKKQSLFGYGSGVAACTDPVYGDVVLAEYTLPFNEADVTYYHPLFQRVVHACQQYPTHVTADAAFDFWSIYETVAHGSGIAAIALNSHGHEKVPRDPDGTPRCAAGLRMQPAFFFQHTRGYRVQRFRCPLLLPQPSGQNCEHAQFLKGKGCVKDANWEKGGLMRALLDRDGPLYHVIYNQRTACERINSQAQALGIERPKVRNIRSVRNLNTLTYLVINAKAFAEAKSINTGLLQIN
ncbi:MAG TPA: transposase [Ktedonobacteraceae bacterium]|nr:transposase [Ktedonobacteraceae bacterium]